MNRRPITIVTGFLGSGKTTLINRLLSDRRFVDCAVLINEFGEIPIDHLLVRETIDNAIVLASGCICCTIRGDLVDTLTDLHDCASRGIIPAFERVLVETTGLAQPAPIIQSLASTSVAMNFRIGNIVCTIDAVNGAYQLANYTEANAQLAAADLVYLSKTDIAADTRTVRATIDAINPGVPVIDAPYGNTDAGRMLETSDRETSHAAAGNWLRPDATGTAAHDACSNHVHSSGVTTIPLLWAEPVEWPSLERWLQLLLSLRGRDILRLKGLANIVNQDGPRVIHGIQHLLHQPRDLPRWPDEDYRTRILLICRNMSPEGVRRSFADAMSASNDHL